ncbi:MAG: hypothetical protein NVV62_16105 [Terricaulis sp.]|nr:hypothetical protein [Terricaulis sp.]
MRRAAESPGPAPSAAAKFRAQQAERMRRERARAAVAVWGATGAALAASATGMVAFRQDVAEIWPRSASAFAALGLDVNVYGLEFYDLAVERAFDGPTPILLVSGEVRNIGRDNKMAPPVRISLRDSRGQEIFDLVNVITEEPLAAGGATPFQIRVDNPPVDAVDLEATFASFAEAPYAGGPARVSPTAATHEEPLVLDQAVPEGEGAEEPASALASRCASGMAEDALRVLLREEEVAARVDALAARLAPQMDADWTLVALLQGAIPFAADLLRALARHGRHPILDSLWLESYRDARELGQGCGARRYFAADRRPARTDRR